MKRIDTILLRTTLGFVLNAQEVKQYRSAAEVYQQAAKYSDDDLDEYAYDEYMSIDENDTAYFEAQFYAVITASDLGRYDTVITNSLEALSHPLYNKYRHEFQNYICYAYVQKKEFDAAIESFEEPLKEFPNYYLIHFNYARALYLSGRFQDALTAYQICISLNPNFAAAHYYLGIMCEEAGEKTRSAYSGIIN